MLARAMVALPMVLGLLASAGAQVGNPAPPRPPAIRPRIQVMPTELRGTVVGVRPGVVGLTTAAGETWAVKIPPKAEVRVTGKAEPGVLRPGIYVRFIAPVDKRRSQVQAKVRKLMIFSPSRETGRMPGVFYAGQEGSEAGLVPGGDIAAPGAPGAPKPGDGAGPPGRGAGGRAKGRRGAGEDRQAPGVERFDIRGRVTRVKGRWLTVAARNTFFRPTLRVELADEPEILLDVNTYALAQPGDKIAAQGVQIAPQTVQALTVAIELSHPVVGDKEKRRRREANAPSRQTAEEAGRRPFEVADAMGQPEAGQPDRAAAPADADKPGKPGPEAEPGGPQDERSRQIMAFLEADPEQVQDEPGVKLELKEGGSITFRPCKRRRGKEVLGRFGLPDQVQPIQGSLPLGEGGQQKEIQWQLWVYGPVLFFVDEAESTRYLALRGGKTQKPPEKQQGQQESPPQAREEKEQESGEPNAGA